MPIRTGIHEKLNVFLAILPRIQLAIATLFRRFDLREPILTAAHEIPNEHSRRNECEERKESPETDGTEGHGKSGRAPPARAAGRTRGAAAGLGIADSRADAGQLRGRNAVLAILPRLDAEVAADGILRRHLTYERALAGTRVTTLPVGTAHPQLALLSRLEGGIAAHMSRLRRR